ncbi:TetR/AcrR family transcriptional regulator [Vibrio aestuarianus]|uniref:TetR/AcrR family transcriptional regulator n=1 Tax=Vibrio aestuarianus TaxID=28171 RepID=A0A9X4EVM7_9VIBR|nr:TetR/AcrR family transcriptional regulator [Vibrio aestuarianus]MDE1241550.1 TetR/AcrR family transcriptional regulator [Vibrio aestuarianus]MDE1263555.1 TetR/AcrR family transcriptional regulator [Vibrio aestuarianus]MDE1295445.1 TetR/AcrR family transcriptional regulator [Vibrio aestuarianus]
MRSAEFDREHVLRAAMNEFIAKGYNKTSMQDLKRVTGLHPGSIYCAFENKRGLLLAALDHYAKTKADDFEQFFTNSDQILNGFKAYLSDIINHTNCSKSNGCLLQNSLTELEQHDDEIETIIYSMAGQWKQRIKSKLEQAKLNHEITPEANCEFLSDYLMMGIYGLRSFSNTKPPQECLQQLVDHLIDNLKI